MRVGNGTEGSAGMDTEAEPGSTEATQKSGLTGDKTLFWLSWGVVTQL
jgi:hypothetical protein